MALQVDIIPATGTDHFTTNIEDGVALADETLRATFAERYPAAWDRIQARRRFMGEALGHRAAPRRAAVLQHPGVAAAVPAPARSRHDDGGIGLRRRQSVDDRDGFDLDQLPSVSEDRHTDQRARRCRDRRALHRLPHGGLAVVVRSRDVDRGLDDVVGAALRPVVSAAIRLATT